MSKRLNVLVYAGKGTTSESVSHALFTLRRHLTPNYAVLPVSTPSVLISEPWTSYTALLVIPGGADLNYCADLNGEGNRRIRQFVENGGAYLGFCAGGYYGCGRCEFEVGSKKGMEVVGSRELAFFPGTCRGAAFAGFGYGSESGARACKLKSADGVMKDGRTEFRSYYNGGGVFVDAQSFTDKGVEVLATYEEDLDIEHGQGEAAAVVLCKVGNGRAILAGPHPEFASVNLRPKSETTFFPEMVQKISNNDDTRNEFLVACLTRLGLQVNREENVVPKLSSLHLTALIPSSVTEVRHELRDVLATDDGKAILKDEQDTFELILESAFDMSELQGSIQEQDSQSHEQTDVAKKALIPEEAVKHIVIHDQRLPLLTTTPSFDHELYYKYQEEYTETTSGADPDYGHWLLYGEVVTSTNSLLEKNPKLLSRLPSGLTAVAGVQVAGRGRGSNVWVSPPGSLMFSMVVKHEVSLMTKAPVIFLQYLAAIAVVEGIKTYGEFYDQVPVKIKWPNDVYALEPSFPRECKTKPPRSSYVKIGGILVNSSYYDKTFNAVVGIGLNTTNTLPTTSVAALVEKLPQSSSLPVVSKERLLARIITTFSVLYTRFCRTGFDSHLQGLYYKHWLHSEQEVTLESEGGARAVIKGITSDGGMLVAEEVSGAKRKIHLQSDFNSFDFLQGLVRKKI